MNPPTHSAAEGWLTAIVLGLILLSMLVNYANGRDASPILAIVSRWVRWALFAFVFAYVCVSFGGSERPVALLVATGALLWPVFETIYLWVAIGAMSRSPIPLFPDFDLNGDGDEWPAHKRFFVLKDWIRQAGFRHLQSLKADLAEGVHLRASIFQDAENLTRLQVLFIPQRNGVVVPCIILSSLTTAGERIVTDNIFLPFGGFYPENWFLERRPLRRSAAGLLRLHRRRCERHGVALAPWQEEPVEDINTQQRLLERMNTELGFLFPPSLREDYGRLTSEGRYRVWKEVWFLNYFGRPARY